MSEVDPALAARFLDMDIYGEDDSLNILDDSAFGGLLVLGLGGLLQAILGSPCCGTWLDFGFLTQAPEAW